jgi:hypothetical protein
MDAAAVDPDFSAVVHDALTKGDHKALLSVVLTVSIMALRDHTLGKVTAQNKLGELCRWVANTHAGGVLSSVLGSALGAVLAALGTHTSVSPGALLNVFFVAAASSGFATWAKLPAKHAADKAARAAAAEALAAEAPAAVAAETAADAPQHDKSDAEIPSEPAMPPEPAEAPAEAPKPPRKKSAKPKSPKSPKGVAK